MLSYVRSPYRPYDYVPQRTRTVPLLLVFLLAPFFIVTIHDVQKTSAD
jgi:hypothetical protein